ncbi:MAG: S-layer homology domain-containing protein [Candidatus Gracilibacteria bacterium]|nr:S-layer homology domain-containing protein [Candidatus Gracilibacteria bacterium]
MKKTAANYISNSSPMTRRLLSLCLVVLWSLLPLFSALGADSDGISSPPDRYPDADFSTPEILSPAESENVIDDSRQVTFSGVSEIETTIDILESGFAICSADTCDGGICQTGIVEASGSAVSFDSDSLLGSGIVDQFFYDTLRDGGDSSWRTASGSSWYAETKDDSGDSVCDYQMGDGDGDPRSGGDDRCGAATFPQRTLLLATTDRLLLFDAEQRTFWKSFAVTGISTVSALNGRIFVGTDSGVVTLDFANDSLSTSPTYTTTSSPAINGNDIRALDVTEIGGETFLLILTNVGLNILNVDQGTKVGKVSAAVDASFTTSNKLLYSTGASTFLSNTTADALIDDWAHTDISSLIAADGGIVSTVDQNALGLSTGGAVLTESDGAAFVSRITPSLFTLPYTIDTLGHWSGSVTDLGPLGNDLTDSTSVSTTPVATGAELSAFQFDGMSKYFSSTDADFDVTGQALTVGMWLRRPTAGGSGPYEKILIKGESDTTRTYWVSAGDPFFDYGLEKDPYFFGVKTANGERAASIHDFSTNTWQFVVGVYDGTNVKIYLNGQEVDQNPDTPEMDRVSLTGNMVSSAEELRMGWGYDDEFFEGDVALPFITEAAFSETQVSALYAASQKWFVANSTETLLGTEAGVTDVSCDDARGECSFLTAQGVTRRTAQGQTDQSSSSTSLQSAQPTYLAEWSCAATFNPSGYYTVQARVGMGGADSTILSSERTFGIFTAGGDSDSDGFSNDIDNQITIPISQPVISSPSADEIVLSETVSFAGVSDAADVGTSVKIYEDAALLCTATVDSAGDWTCDATLTVGSHTVTALPAIGAVSAAEAYRSASRTFLVDFGQPVAPTITPLNTYTGTNEVTVFWTSNDERSERFFVEMSPVSDFSENKTSSGGLSSETVSYLLSNLSDTVEYFFRVKAQSIGGIDSEWSSTTSTTVDLSNPVAGTVTNAVGAYSSDGILSFSWDGTGFTDATSGIDHYEVQVSTDQAFAAPEQTILSDTNYISTNLSTDLGENGSTYYARVRAVDQVSHASDWATSTGTLIDTTAPTSFTLNAPTSPSAGTTQTLSWTAAADPESGLGNYTVYRRTFDLSGESPVMTEDFTIVGTSAGQSLNVSGLQHEHLYEFKVVAANQAGLTTESNVVELEIDTTLASPPVFENTNNYTTTDTIDLAWTAVSGGFVANQYELFRNSNSLDTTEASVRTYSDTAPKSDGSTYDYTVRALDDAEPPNAGEFSTTLHVLVDKADPTTASAVDSGTAGDNGWYTSPVVISLTATDPGTTLFDPLSTTGGESGYYSGVDQISYEADGGQSTQYTAPVQLNGEGTHTLAFEATDVAGNTETQQSETYKIDTVAPTATFTTQAPLDLTAHNGFVTEDSVSFSVSTEDTTSGVNSASVQTLMSFDENGDGTITGDDTDFAAIEGTSYAFATDGRYKFKVTLADNAGNTGESTVTTINVDRTAPITLVDAPTTTPEGAFVIYLLPSDQPAVAAGVQQTYYSVDGGNTWETGTEISSTDLDIDAEGNYNLHYYSVDMLGNQEAVKQIGLDTDEDGMPDWWEEYYSLDPNDPTDASEDPDGDTLLNLAEYQNSTDPTDADSDNDTVSDGTEVTTDGTNPLSAISHRFLPLFSQTPAETKGTFVLYGTASPNVSIQFSRTTGGGNELLGTATADANGKVVFETTLSTGEHTLSASFSHSGGTATNDSLSVTVSTSAQNPQVADLSDGDRVNPSLTELDVSGVASGASLQVFQIVEGLLSAVGTATADESGAATVPIVLSPRTEGLFVYDQTNDLTSELLSVDTTVYLMGRVIDTDGIPLGGVNVRAISSEDEIFTLTGSDGSFQVSVPIQADYHVKIWDIAHHMVEQDISILYSDVYLSPRLSQITGDTLVQREDGLFQPTGSGEVTFAGFKRGYWSSENGEIRMSYSDSLDQVLEYNKGIESEIVYITDSEGKERFAGYRAGRLAADEYKKEEKRVLGWMSFDSERVQMKAAAEKHCLESRAVTMDFVDIPTETEFYRVIAKMYSLGLLQPNEDRAFEPHKPMTWEETLEIVLAERCRVPESAISLRRDDLPELDWGPLRNEPTARLFYTALKYNLIETDFDPQKPVTRDDAIRLLATAFDLPINSKATNTAFVDITSEEELAPILVAAKQHGIFDLFPRRIFAPERPIARDIFSAWFVGGFEYKHEREVPEEETKESLKGAVPRMSREISEIDAYEALEKKQAVNQKQIDEVRELFEPLRPDSGWNPMGDSGRERIWHKDNTWNIKRNNETWEEFRARKAKALGDLESFYSSAGLTMPDVQGMDVFGPMDPDSLTLPSSGLQILDRSQFVKRLGETDEEFATRVRKALEDLKRVLEEERAKEKAVEESSLDPTDTGSMIQYEDRSWNIRRLDETEAEFQARRQKAMEELGLLEAEAPLPEAEVQTPLQEVQEEKKKLPLWWSRDDFSNTQRAGETDEEFAARKAREAEQVKFQLEQEIEQLKREITDGEDSEEVSDEADQETGQESATQTDAFLPTRKSLFSEEYSARAENIPLWQTKTQFSNVRQPGESMAEFLARRARQKKAEADLARTQEKQEKDPI